MIAYFIAVPIAIHELSKYHPETESDQLITVVLVGVPIAVCLYMFERIYFKIKKDNTK